MLVFITCGHWSLDNARLVISATVFFRESGSWRETATGWRDLKIAVKQILENGLISVLRKHMGSRLPQQKLIIHILGDSLHTNNFQTKLVRMLSFSFCKMGSKTQKTYSACQLRSFTVDINMQNSPKHILIILLLFLTKHFRTILREWPDWVCSQATLRPNLCRLHPKCSFSLPFSVTKHAHLQCKLQKKTSHLIQSLHQNMWTPVIKNLAKDYLLCPNPVLLS